MKKYINRIIVALLMCLWLTWHLIYEALRFSYSYGDKGYIIINGFFIHGSILIDMILWFGLILLFILLVIIE